MVQKLMEDLVNVKNRRIAQSVMIAGMIALKNANLRD